MKATVLARLASFFLVVALLLPAIGAVARPAGFGRYGKPGMHRPVYKKYQPGCRWIFQK